MRRIAVSTSSGGYEVIVGEGALDLIAQKVVDLGANKTLLLSDSNTSRLFGTEVADAIVSASEIVRCEVEAGESSKTIQTAASALSTMAAAGMRRSDLVVSLGGGTITDLGGFIASVYARGIKVLHIPTTLLGQVDAAIGGKTGVNLEVAKNMVGTFHQPSAVLADIRVLSSLPPEQVTSGMAEIAKYALVFEPKMMGELPEAARSMARPGLEDLIATCVQIKGSVVAADERDSGPRLHLNYGHTLGHAIEAASGFEMSHGNAISVGMVFASRLAVALGMAAPGLTQVHEELLSGLGLPLSASVDPTKVIEAWKVDKKHTDVSRWVLLQDLGQPVVREDVPDDLAVEVLSTVIG